MAWRTGIVLVLAATACSGKHTEATVGACQNTTTGTSTPDETTKWSCTTSGSDSSQVLPACPGGIAAGGAPCNFAGTVDTTTDPSRPTTLTVTGDCFACPAGGQGIEWKCSTQGWQAANTFSCTP